MPRTNDKWILADKADWYMLCPNCGSVNVLRDLHRHHNTCFQCNFQHKVFEETVQEALNRYDAQKASQK